MRMTSFRRFNEGLVLETSKGRLKLEVCSDGIIHVVYTLENEFSAKKSLMVVWEPGGPVEWSTTEDEETVSLATSKLRLIINKETCAFTYLDSSGRTIAREPARGGKTLVPIDVEKAVFDQNTEIKSERGVDGVTARARNLKTVVDRKAYHTKLEFQFGEGEALYGLGSHEEGIMNHRGHHQYLYQQNMKAVVPVLISTRGYGILMDSYSLMTFHDDVYGSYIWTDVDDELDYYFIYGPEFDGIVAGYRKLTGKAPMLPRWAYGYVQSKERYKTQDELVSVVKEYRDRKIPLDLIVLDWCSWPGDLWGQKSFDPERFPDPEKMMQDIHDMDARLMVSIWPIMRNNGPDHLEMQEHHCLLGNEATYNAFSEKARALYWDQANRGYFSHGVDAWWCDCTEPFESDWRGEVKPEPEERMIINTAEAKKYIDPEYISAYSLQHSRGIYEGQRSTTSDKRVVNLTRSVYAGQQRYSTIVWSGDISANWETLRRQIPSGLNFCAAGIPYWTLDIGAFFVRRGRQWFWDGRYDAGCEDEGYRELYVRWFQYGAFLPMFRSHGTDTPREVWRFGEPGSITYDTLVKFDYLRYRLIPYIYSLAGMVTHREYTIMRMLPFDFRYDPSTYDIDDQFMFGPALLVNPVTTPMYYEAGSKKLDGVKKTRSVYLPCGFDWYDFWTGEKVSGGQTIEARATLDTMPLYVRAGSIIPMGPKVQHTSEQLDAPYELRVYPGADGEFTIYDDEGDNYNYENGAYAMTTVRWDDHNETLVFGERQGSFDGMVSERIFRVVRVSAGNGVGVEETTHVARTVSYDGREITVSLK